jgi:hypothetical protein
MVTVVNLIVARPTARRRSSSEPGSADSDIEDHDIPVSGLIDQVLNSFGTEQLAELFTGRLHQRAESTKGRLSAGTSLGILIESAR